MKKPQPVCSACFGEMLAGVPGSYEPTYWCPNHPDAEPLEVDVCEHCNGKGFVIKDA